jgi:hypothetical protein
MLGKIDQRSGPAAQAVQTAHDNRMHTRYQGVYAEYALIEGEENLNPDHLQFKAGFIRDFSMGGSSLQIYDNLPADTLILLRLYDPNIIRPIEILSGLVWKDPERNYPARNRARFNVGLRYLYMDKENRHALNRMIDYFETLRPKESGIIEYL